MSKDEALKLALEPWGTYMGHRMTPAGTKEFWGVADAPIPEGTKLYTTPPAAPAQEIVCSTGLCHYKPAAPDLQAELNATNKQVEILSDALAESRRHRPWVGLTDEQKHEIELKAGITEDDDGYIVSQVFRLTEAKLKELNT